MDTPKPNIWKRDAGTVEEINFSWSMRLQFMADREGEQVTFTKKFTVRSNVLEIASHLATFCNGRIRSLWDGCLYVEGSVAGSDILVEIDVDRQSSAYDDDEAIDETRVDGILLPTRIATYSVDITGPREAIIAAFKHLDTIYRSSRAAQLCWWYDAGSRGPQYKKIFLPPLTTELHPEYYPSLDGGPNQFLGDYLKADESVLLMAGPPGTGKTTLLRHMIIGHKLVAHVCYDERLMATDSLFQSFLMDKEADVLIIEDADAILTDRERDGNHLMSRFLNVSDGLIKLPNKKLIFTTNLTDFAKVDSALLRPGRCFALLHTRHLTLKEAQEASQVGGFPTPTERKEYTLADLFNQGKSKAGVRRIGYTG